jgi:two-component system sensor histidine kinase/response regulator
MLPSITITGFKLMWQFLKTIFSPSQYMPHGHCYLWQTPLVWLHVVSDSLIAIAYFSIPAMLIYFVLKRRDIKFSGIFYLFSAFIVGCGIGHLLDVWTLWHPAYWLSGFERAMTALVSCYTALKMVDLLPQFLSLKNPEELAKINRELEKEIAERNRAEAALKNIASGTATATGKEFFAALVTHLAKALDVSYVFVTEAVGQPPEKLKTLAVWQKYGLGDNFEYNLAGTPCAVPTKTLNNYCCTEKLQEHYPDDELIKKLNLESYIGQPLLDESQQVIGNLCILDSSKIIPNETTETILKIFAARAAGELERKWAEEARKKAYDELELRVEERTNDLLAANLALESEIKVRKMIESTLRESENRLRKQQSGLLSLAKSQRIYQGSLSQALEEVTELATRILNVERVSVWFYNENKTEIICANLYERTLNQHSHGQKLSVFDSPKYFEELENDNSMAIYDAKTDPRTADFEKKYLNPFGITSMLDAPIHLKGDTIGVLSIEHTEEKRQWEIEEQNFVSYLAYMISLAIESRDRLKAEQSLREIAERERAIAKMIQKMRQTLDFQTIFSVTTEELRKLLNCDRVGIYRFNSDWSGNFVCESVSDGWIHLVPPNQDNARITDNFMTHDDCTLKKFGTPAITVQDTYLQQTQGGAYKSGNRYLLVEDIYNAGLESCYVELLEQFQARSYITVPIFCGKKLWGLLANYQNSDPRHWTKSDIKLVVEIGNQLGVALHQAELFNQIKKQSAALEKAVIKADAANRAKSEFLASMSHELRTPMNAILGFTQVLDGDVSLSQEHQQHIQIIHRAGEHLLALINDILEMSKIESGHITFNENSFDLYKLLDSLEEMFRLKASGKGLKLMFDRSPDIPQYVKTDESKLRQVLINLLSNAIKFTEQGGVKVRIKVIDNPVKSLNGDYERSAMNQPIALYFEVEDTGFGIAPEERDKLFEPFAQTETGRKSQQGTGLGIPISQKFIQMMGGNLTVKSAIGSGSTFAFDIQIQSADLNQLPNQIKFPKVIGLAPDQPKYRILVVEDRLENRLLLMEMLSKWGFQAVREATNGQEALEIYQNWQPNLIWMDMQMPVMDGYEATKRIKADALAQNPVIIALTASAFEEDRKKILEIGCDDFVRKPFQKDEILSKMEQYLGVRYIYEDAEASTEAKSESGTDEIEQDLEFYLSQMSRDWLSKVHRAAEECNDDMIYQLISEISSENAPLAQALTDLVNDFLFDEIMELTKPDEN